MSAWKILKDAVSGYIAHEALTRGAAIAFYAVTSLAPVLVIVVAIAGLVFGQEAVRSNLVGPGHEFSRKRGRRTHQNDAHASK